MAIDSNIPANGAADHAELIGIRDLVGAASPQRLFGARPPGAIVFGAALALLAQGGEHLAWGRQRSAINVLLRIPQLRAQERARALEIDGVDLDHHDRAWRLLLDGEGLE